MVSGKICFDFARTGSCKFKNCRYSHVVDQSKPAGKGRESRSSARGQQTHAANNNFDDLTAWKRKAPNSLLLIRPLGVELGPFFSTARRLIDVDDDSTAQEVIQCLSQEGGLHRIQELIQRHYTQIPSTTKQDMFGKQFLPFLELITHHKVLASLVMEQFVVKIYNYIFGPAGNRAEPFLNFLADIVQLEVEQRDEATSTHLELSLLVFCKIIELNSTAFIQEHLKPAARRFHDLFMVLHPSQTAGPLDRSRHHLEVLQRRLEIGSSLTPLLGNSRPLPSRQAPVAFITPKDPPGGRHNNDHADICRIRIMPTFQEILSARSEYLPGKDPQQWHIGGLAGLLDRNFRLLREDTVGQLRDVIHAELRPSTLGGAQKSQVRTNVYQNVKVQGLDFDRWVGLQFVAQFAQPLNVRAMSKDQRKDWWELSKRLQPSALVCLTDPRGFAIFCTVAGSERPRADARQERRQRKASSLWGDASISSVIMELVEPTEENRQYILDCHKPRNGRCSLSLIEFPGILLPSFQPTLKALQAMKKAADLPMSEFLAPDETYSGMVDMPPPKYATGQGFSFNLQCLMKDRSDLLISPSQAVDLKKLQEQSTLDDAQAQALVQTLQRKIGLIQGPPGTGKSYTGVALIKVLLANKVRVKSPLGPIICVCYTNHALDQLLEDLLDDKVTTQIIRIGAQSKSGILQPLNLRNVVQQFDKTRLEKQERWKLHVAFENHEKEFDALRLDAIGTDKSLEFHLKRHHMLHYNQLFRKDENGFQKVHATRRKGNAIQAWVKSGQAIKGQPRGVESLEQAHLDTMTAKERRILYEHWIKESRQDLHTQAHRILTEHQEHKASFDKIRDELDLRCLRNADVIGVTTTGLARNLNMLRRLQSKVIMCEEAGEVLEAHLLTSLLPSAEHIILIGDHQQLRPQIQNYGLSRENRTGQQYSLDRSLFERLVEPDDDIGIRIPFSTLETQRRMHPSIAQLVRDTLYPRLQDALSVSEYPEVAGMRKRLFWLDHRRPEGNASIQDAMATSHWNDHEIDLTLALVNHLLRQGEYEAGDIAVLTPYLGQLHRMRRKLSQSFTITLGERDQDDLDKAGFAEDEKQTRPSAVSRSTLLQALRVATIDNFQGEEAKVVVISLVRSNSQNRCGFLRTPNRINVLLSRAQHGMYIIGNSETSRGVEMWHQVLNILEEHENIGTSLDLRCPRHPSTPISVSQPDDFVQFSPEGGCSLQCGETYREIDLNENPCVFPPCGHFLTVESMDAQMDLGKHYVMNDGGQPVSIASSSEPFSISDVRNCATCRGSLRSVARYGRLVRRALLDEATKKFILYVNQTYVPMAQALTRLLALLPAHKGTAAAKVSQVEVTLKIEGPPDHQVRLMHQHLRKHDGTRWKGLMSLREQVTKYYKTVKVEEQPFNQVRNMVEDARRRKRKTGHFEFDENVLQTKGCVQAAALLLRLDTALLSDFLALYKQAPGGSNKCTLQLDLQANRKESEKLTAMAINTRRVLQQVEGYLFRAQLCALERQNSTQPARAEDLLKEGNECITQAQVLCDAHPGQVRGLSEEIEGTLKMLQGGTFYTPVTSEERMAIVAAMAREFRGTGHWYRCENNHPFTIGECGGAMQISTCPECGARVGGQRHQTVAGVTRANDLEEDLDRPMI
ncbi:hypothetical protein ETB97_009110 [Aspergillus alliaceus]|uniref:NFX1-type zinc finger-containing protein 1 n=1 Tax=Petromyces alliaceus TaxID=209559 RepID=A0A8H5ZTM8_PETAA|nr:hypothetical protein ETB97_009110 [Aspergillus burnettii]